MGDSNVLLLVNIVRVHCTLQVVTPQRMELLRVKLREEVEGPYKEVPTVCGYHSTLDI